MAFGQHWEWRGFGPLRDEELRRAIRELPAVYPAPQAVLDRYLWAPGCPLNVKLRFGDFKIKRLLGRGASGIEEWLEDEAENHSFPLRRAAVADVARELGLPLPAPSPEPIRDGDELVAALGGSAAGIRVIRVVKKRWTHRLADRGDVLVEYAEIAEPERIASVAVECAEPAPALQALELLGLRERLRPMSYLGALEVWGRGERILGP